MSTIHNKDGKTVSQGKNLRIILEGARKYGGVVSIEIHELSNGGAGVYIHYANGYTGYSPFVCSSHAVNWAKGKKAGRSAWWNGCNVRAYDGQWREVKP